MKTIIFDIETYPNYLLFSFKNIATGNIIELESFNDEPLDTQRLKRMVTDLNHTLIGFNSRNFDLPITFAAIDGANMTRIMRIVDYIINGQHVGWQAIQHFDITEYPCDHIDIQEPTPSVGASLKLYGARLGTRVLQELPYDPCTELTREQANNIKRYCRNDLQVTSELFRAIEPEIRLREVMSDKYGTDLRSKSGAQIAKVVTKHMLESKTKKKFYPTKLPDDYNARYTAPDWLSFESDNLKGFLQLVQNTPFTLGAGGKPLLPKELSKPIEIADRFYKVGMGGLHSQEKAQTIIPPANHLFGEFDIASMYPSLIMTLGVAPENIGIELQKILSPMLAERLKAKRNGDKDTANSLKLILNSTFGLFGNKWNHLYSPECLLKITITGQLFLLMVIERLTMAGHTVTSANTDGVNVLFHVKHLDGVKQIIAECEFESGLNFEFTPYKATYAESVNSYLAITTDGKVKSKGSFALPSLSNNASGNIITLAVRNYLTKEKDLLATIHACTDIKDFLLTSRVTGGAEYKGEYLGKVVRFYYSTESDEPLRYIKNGNKVAKSDNSKPLMNLPAHLPDDIDYERYRDEASKMLTLCGAFSVLN